jgi:hypothetical protein
MRETWALVMFLALVGCEREDSTSAPSSMARLIEAGWSFGFCLGPCNGTLTFQNESLVYRVTDREGAQVLASSQARLTASGTERLASLVSSLPQGLDETYGCPDCADAGAAYIVVSREGANRRSSYEYPNPPRELAQLDAFLKEIMESMGACQTSALVTLEGECSAVPR